MRRFPSRPLPDFKCLHRALSRDVTLDNELTFFQLGRDALVYGLEALDIKPGATILIPAYMCNSTIKPLMNLGYNIIFFDVKVDLNCDLNIIESLISSSNVKAILSVHYFGFPCDLGALVKLCRQYDVRVIEDCSHSYLTQISGRSVGYFGDMAIYSMRKTVAIPDGGALKLNVGIPLNPQFIEKKMQLFKEVLYLASRVLETIICFIGFPNLYSAKIDWVKKIMRNIGSSENGNVNLTVRATPIKGSFQLKAYLYDSDYTSYVVERRRHNYKLLVGEAEKLGFKVLFPQLPDGCVPQFFILIDETHQLAPWLREQCIGAVVWPGPELPQEISSFIDDFPITNYLNDNLVMLPIHQSVSDEQCRSTIALLQRFVGSK